MKGNAQITGRQAIRQMTKRYWPSGSYKPTCIYVQVCQVTKLWPFVLITYAVASPGLTAKRVTAKYKIMHVNDFASQRNLNSRTIPIIIKCSQLALKCVRIHDQSIGQKSRPFRPWNASRTTYIIIRFADCQMGLMRNADTHRVLSILVCNKIYASIYCKIRTVTKSNSARCKLKKTIWLRY